MRTIGLIFDEIGRSENADDVLDFDKMDFRQLKDFAVRSGIDFPAGVKKSELLEIVKQAFEEAMPY